MDQFHTFMSNFSVKKSSKTFFLQNCKNMEIQFFIFFFKTFDSVEAHKRAIPKNNPLNQTNLPYFIAFHSKLTINGLKLGIYESQIFGISLY